MMIVNPPLANRDRLALAVFCLAVGQLVQIVILAWMTVHFLRS
jgi:hypothetical protein